MELEENKSLNLENNQKTNFLDNIFLKNINDGINIGLKAILPDMLENEVIKLKDNLIEYGLKDGINKTIESFFKRDNEENVLENFDNLIQIKNIINNDKFIDKITTLLDSVINKVGEEKIVDDKTFDILKNEESLIINKIKNNINLSLKENINCIESLNKFINNWNEYFNSKDLVGMKKEYNKIENEIKNIIPTSNIKKDINYIESIQKLIENNGKNFELTNDEIELAQKLNNM